MLDTENDLPLQLDYTVYVTFEVDEDDREEKLPRVVEIFTDMRGADYNIFIQYFAWNAEPLGESMFFDTHTVTWNTDVVLA